MIYYNIDFPKFVYKVTSHTDIDILTSHGTICNVFYYMFTTGNPIIFSNPFHLLLLIRNRKKNVFLLLGVFLCDPVHSGGDIRVIYCHLVSRRETATYV